MNKKTESQFIDHGCGFPILLLNVPMIKVRGKWIPDINYEILERSVLLHLCYKPCKLTGNEIRFIRLFFDLTLQNFAKRFGVQHPTIVKWEKFKNDPTNMSLGTEKDIRLFVMKELRGKKYVGDLYTKLEQIHLAMRADEELLQVNIEKLAC